MTELTIAAPMDCHLHLRDGKMLISVLPFTTMQFDRAIVMPNLPDPITTTFKAREYRNRILAVRCAIHPMETFEPLMTAYLTDKINPIEIRRGFEKDDKGKRIWYAAKLYPAGATTNSQAGVTNIEHLFDSSTNIGRVIGVMEEIGMPLLLHGERLTDSTGKRIPILNREHEFLGIVKKIMQEYPNLKIVLEHITTATAMDVVIENYTRGNRNLVATITPHHLFLTLEDIFDGGLQPDNWCLPIAKAEEDRLALRRAATSGLSCFFLGTDSAPHLKKDKYKACGCAGIFNAPNAIELYTQVFSEEGALDKLQGFASNFGPTFYGLKRSERHVTLTKWPQEIKPTNRGLVIFREGKTVSWTLKSGPR